MQKGCGVAVVLRSRPRLTYSVTSVFRPRFIVSNKKFKPKTDDGNENKNNGMVRTTWNDENHLWKRKSLEKFDLNFEFVSLANMEEEWLLSYTLASHQGAIQVFCFITSG